MEQSQTGHCDNCREAFLFENARLFLHFKDIFREFEAF
jgi:hypothetical protein